MSKLSSNNNNKSHLAPGTHFNTLLWSMIMTSIPIFHQFLYFSQKVGMQNLTAPLLYVGMWRVTSVPIPDSTSLAVRQYKPESKYIKSVRKMYTYNWVLEIMWSIDDDYQLCSFSHRPLFIRAHFPQRLLQRSIYEFINLLDIYSTNNFPGFTYMLWILPKVLCYDNTHVHTI